LEAPPGQGELSSPEPGDSRFVSRQSIGTGQAYLVVVTVAHRDLRHTAVALWIAASAGPKEVATHAGHTSVSFTLDRYGHLHPESDAALRDRLDALYSAGQRDQDAAVVDLFQERSRPRRHPRTQGTPPALGR
jgi:hypothetical protein